MWVSVSLLMVAFLRTHLLFLIRALFSVCKRYFASVSNREQKIVWGKFGEQNHVWGMFGWRKSGRNVWVTFGGQKTVDGPQLKSWVEAGVPGGVFGKRW